MKRLIVMRHAKSSWADPGQADAERPLNPRGRRDAAAIGGWLAQRGYVPEAALVSSAVRTRETWELLGPAFASIPATPRPDLYDALPDHLRAALQSAPDADRLLILGHQPGVGALAQRMLEAIPDDPAFAKYPTAATTVIDFDVSEWRAADRGRLVAFVTPKSLAANR